jgi:hypothetical protein
MGTRHAVAWRGSRKQQARCGSLLALYRIPRTSATWFAQSPVSERSEAISTYAARKMALLTEVEIASRRSTCPPQ